MQDGETVWTRPARGLRGPRPDRSRPEITQAAIELADMGGLAAVTMRAVAQSLGTTAGALYRYVASRDELLDLMSDAVLAELRLDPADGCWDDRLVEVARNQMTLYLRHPWLPEASMRAGAVLGPRAMDYFEHCLTIMAELPVGTTTKMEALGVLTGVAVLFTRSQPPDPGATARMFAAATPTAHPVLTRALARAGPPPSPGDLFERTVRSLLHGLLTATG